jgi:hypothetical protein
VGLQIPVVYVQVCNTNSRRKVRCNEQKPRCSHCERLNLQCNWKTPATASEQPRKSSESTISQHEADFDVAGTNIPAVGTNSILQDTRNNALDGSFNDVFDYASFMWENDLQDGSMQSNRWREFEFPDVDILGGRGGMVSRHFYS